MDNNFNNDIDKEGFDFERFLAEEEALKNGAYEEKPSKGKVSKKKTELATVKTDETSENEDENSKTKKEKAPKPKGNAVYEWIQSLVSALLICVIVFAFFFRSFGIVGSSMVPTLHDGDNVIITNLFYTPEYGDVVVLRKDTFQDEPIIKRVIATEGQTVSMDFEKGIVYVNDIPLDEPYINEKTHTSLDFSSKIKVPEGCVFVMGDNRNASTDSRYSTIGCVDTRYIMGKVILRILPFSDFGPLD